MKLNLSTKNLSKISITPQLQNAIKLLQFSAIEINQEIQNIFFIQGGLMTIIGGLIGLFLGTIIIGLQLCFDLLMITPSLAYPVVLKGSNFAIAFSTILILGLIASRLASWNLKKLQFTDQAN